MGEGDSYAWAGNIGWIELISSRPNHYDGVRVTDTRLSGYAWSDSTSWTPNLAGIMSPDAGAQTTRNAFTPPGPSRFFQVQALVPLQP